MDIKIQIEAAGLEKAINNLAQALSTAGAVTHNQTVVATKEAEKVKKDKPVKETKQENPKKDEPKKETAAKEERAETKEQEISLEVVRGKLADFSSKGKENQTKVVDALSRFGVKKLTDVEPEDYKELLDLVGLSV